MANYRRLISYIYAYEGGIKGKNVGFAKLEVRNGQCKLQVNVRNVYIGSQDTGVYLLCGSDELLVGKIFIRNGAGEFRAIVPVNNVAGSGQSIDKCYGLTVHNLADSWQSYTTIWEDAVTHAAEVILAEAASEQIEEKETDGRPDREAAEEKTGHTEPRKNSIADAVEAEIEAQSRKSDPVPSSVIPPAEPQPDQFLRPAAELETMEVKPLGTVSPIGGEAEKKGASQDRYPQPPSGARPMAPSRHQPHQPRAAQPGQQRSSQFRPDFSEQSWWGRPGWSMLAGQEPGGQGQPEPVQPEQSFGKAGAGAGWQETEAWDTRSGSAAQSEMGAGGPGQERGGTEQGLDRMRTESGGIEPSALQSQSDPAQMPMGPEPGRQDSRPVSGPMGSEPGRKESWSVTSPMGSEPGRGEPWSVSVPMPSESNERDPRPLSSQAMPESGQRESEPESAQVSPGFSQQEPMPVGGRMSWESGQKGFRPESVQIPPEPGQQGLQSASGPVPGRMSAGSNKQEPRQASDQTPLAPDRREPETELGQAPQETDKPEVRLSPGQPPQGSEQQAPMPAPGQALTESDPARSVPVQGQAPSRSDESEPMSASGQMPPEADKPGEGQASGQPQKGSGQTRPGFAKTLIDSNQMRPGSGRVRPGSGQVRPGQPQPEQEQLEEEPRMDSIWQHFYKTYPKIQAFDYNGGCDILTIKPQDIGLLPREVWGYGNNSFLLHGYYSHRYLILARLNNPKGEPRFLLGVPGHYYSNEKYMAAMFGFPNFVLSKIQPAGDVRFGYWYTDIRLGYSLQAGMRT